MSREPIYIIAAAISVALLWAFCIPVWHFPDEQAHFAQVQDYAEINTLPKGNDVSWEIFESTRVLGTLRDDLGHNRYTPTTGYQLPLSASVWGYEEAYVKNMVPISRTTYVKQEAPRYPPLYYALSSIGYRLVHGSDLLTRLFAVRIVSVLLFGGTVLAAWLLAQELFPERLPLQIASTMAIAFQPMFMFVGSGVTNDVLMNFVGTALIAAVVPLFHRPITMKDSLIILGLMIAGMFTKQLLFLLYPVIALAVLYSLLKYSSKKVILLALTSAILALLLGWFAIQRLNQGFWLPFWPSVNAAPVVWIKTYGALLVKLYKETFAWYWGVYKWLSLVLPLPVLRAIKVSIGISLAGLGGALWFERKYLSFERLQVWIFMAALNIVYFLMLTLWDTTQTIQHGFSHGIQGRYFFPLLSTHMTLLVYGWWLAFGHWLGRWYSLLISIVVVSLNLFSLWYVLGAYYDRLPLNRLVIQLSQYKPEFAKWPYVALFIMLAFSCLLMLLITQFHYASKKTDS